MKLRYYVILLALAFSVLIPGREAAAMNMNVAGPYNDQCSGPQTPYLSFYSPQSMDMLFTPASLDSKDAPIDFYCQAGLRNVGLTWSLHRNMIDKPFLTGQAEDLSGDRFHIQISPQNLPAGFYDLKVVLDTGMPSAPGADRPINGVCTFGWNASKMAIQNTRPADFKQFWDKAKASLAAVPLDPRDETPMETFDAQAIGDYNLKSACMPADYDPKGHKTEVVESCKVSFAGPDGGRVYAWMAKPLGKGPFPGLVILPGAGFNDRCRPLEHARHGYVAIDVDIHGQDVDLVKPPTLPGYYGDFQYDPVSAFYYYDVHLRCVQAISYLLSRADVDPNKIAVCGGSQGGRLGIVIGGLDPRVKAVVSTIANSPNYPALVWAAKCNGQTGLGGPGGGPTSDGMDLKGAPPAITTPDGIARAYYDPMNYAQDIKCPVLMLAGMIDPASPPISTFACYNRLTTKEKQIITQPGLAHDWSSAFDRYAWKWLDHVWSENAGK